MEKLCIIYARVSTEDQARNGFSLGAQVRECKERARALGYSDAAIHVLTDEGYSGDAVDRPGLNRLRDLVAEPGRVGHVVILDPDRFARSLSLQLVVTEEIIRGGAALEFLNFDWQDTPEGKLFYSLRGAIAEYEKAKIRERTRRGREQKARQGLLPVGKSLYGYRFDPVTDTLVPVEAERAVLRLMRDLMLEGESGTGARLSAVRVARWLAERGVPAPKGGCWYASTVARMMRNLTYTGTYRVLDGRYSIPVESLWDEQTHRALCDHLAANCIQPRRAQSGPPYLLTRLLRCGECGRRMRGHAVKDRRRDYRYYLCGRSPAFAVPGGRRVRCTGRHWPADLLDGLVWALVEKWLRDMPPLPAPRDTRGQEREALRQALARREAEIERYLRLFAAGHIAEEERLKSLLTPAQAAAEALRARIAALEQPPPNAPLQPPDPARLPAVTRRELVALLIADAVIREGELEVHGFFQPACHAGRSAGRQLER